MAGLREVGEEDGDPRGNDDSVGDDSPLEVDSGDRDQDADEYDLHQRLRVDAVANRRQE